jgi:transposase
MAVARMPDASFELAEHHPPPEPMVGPAGGRPPIGHRRILKVLWFVLATGCRREDVPPEMGCSGRSAHRFLQRREGLHCWDRLRADLLRLLRQAGKLDPDLVIVDAVILRAFGGGELTGPSPVDRGRKGTRHTPLVDRHGVPLAIRTAGADASDHTQIIPLVLDSPEVGGEPGRPKELPDELYADRGYDSDDTRRILAWLGIEPHIARRRAPHGSGLGRVRWVVERTISWLKGLRRMRIRYDRLTVIQEAWDTPAACVICFRLLNDQDAPSG